MTKTVNIHEAKTHLSRLIEEAMAGEDVVIAKAGKPKVRLTVIPPEPKRNRFEMLYGCLKDELAHLADIDWFEPMPEEELKLWYADDEQAADRHLHDPVAADGETPSLPLGDSPAR